MQSKLIVIMLALIATLLSFITYGMFFKPDPCVVHNAYQREKKEKYSNPNEASAASTDTDAFSFTPPGRSPDLFSLSEKIPEKVQRKYDTAYYKCQRSLR